MRHFFLFAFFFLLFATPAFAQGGYAGAFLRVGVAARSESMGRAYVAMAQGSEAAFYNPAGTAFLSAPEINTSFRSLALDRTFAFIGFATALHPRSDPSAATRPLRAGLAVSWIHAGVDNIEARDFDGEQYATLSNCENAFALSFALRPHQQLAIGITGRIVLNRLSGVTQDNGALSASSFGFDFGALLEPLPGVRIGATVRDVNLKYAWNTQGVYELASTKVDHFPVGWSMGVAITRPYAWLTVAADLQKRQYRDAELHLGAQVAYEDVFQVRAGLNGRKPTFGAGYRFELFGRAAELHYAFVTHPDALDSDHIFGWAFVF